MRILHILNDVTDRGNGIVNAAVDLAVEQARQGLDIAVSSAGGGLLPILQEAGVSHFTLDQSRNPLQILRALRLFRRQLVEFSPDIVHAHMRTGMMLAWFWSRFHHFSLVGHVHNVHDRESIIMGLADRVVTVSQSVANSMKDAGISGSKLRVVLNRPLGNCRQPSIDEIRPATLSHPSIVTVAGMASRKGIQELIAAFNIVGSKFNDAHLYLVGDGAERKRFEDQALQSPYSSRIHFEGFQAVPQAWMLSADVFVLASRRESFGLVLTEARAAGCAIVATNVDGIAEALDNGKAGLLVPPRNPTVLAEALSLMLASGQERTFWRVRALQGIREYNVHRMTREITAIYYELAAENACRSRTRTVWP